MDSPRRAVGPAGVLEYDAELQLQQEPLRAAYGIHRSDRVVDVGCGAGLTTREAARMASSGSALGIDLSPRMIERARSAAAADRIANVSFDVGDAAVYPLGESRFDVAISRFGTMFFADPAAAFVNICRSLRTTGRLVMLVWQAHERNEWAVAIDRAFDEALPSVPRPTGAADAFSLGDPSVVERILGAAGFSGVTFADVHAPVYYGPDVDAALAFISRFADVHQRLSGVAAGPGRDARERLRALLAAHDTGHGVWFDARSWLVTARRA